MKLIIYICIIIFANSIGAISGMGGGVIIKPMLDFIGMDTVSTISFYSSVAVFVMSIVSTMKQLKAGVTLNWQKLLLLAVGSMAGGYVGSIAFTLVVQQFGDTFALTSQIILTIMMLLVVLYLANDKITNYQFQQSAIYLLCGLMLGFLASFLGIGGGPINVSLLVVLFNLPIKLATVYSIAIILFSQFTKIITLTFITPFKAFEPIILIGIIGAACIGGFVGALLSQRMSNQQVAKIFKMIVIFVLLLNIYNLFMLFW